MAKALLRFSSGAPSPLYLPLYVLEARQGFNLQAHYSLSIIPPARNDENGDRWAVRELVEGRSEFAVCDPTLAEDERGVRTIATIVGKMAFWAVALQTIKYFE